MKLFSPIYLIGAGGYGKQIFSILKDNEYKIKPTLVDDKLRLSIKKFKKFKKNTNYNITIGNVKLREKIHKFLKKKIFFFQILFLMEVKYILIKLAKVQLLSHTQ